MIKIRNLFCNPSILVITIIIGVFCLHCTPEEEVFNKDFSGGLEFEKDTVLFDTVFSGIGSTTRRLKVYNPSPNALLISNIDLAGGSSSPYKILIDGSEHTSAEQIRILGKDSLLILVEVMIDPQDVDSPYLIRDSIVFNTNGIQQDVKLVAWGQDANYLGNVVLPCNSTWTNDRPYVLFSSVLVDTLCSLTIHAGAQIFASKDSYLLVKGSVHSKGTPEEPVIFRNDRLDPAYENISGQWGGLLFTIGTKDNVLENTIIRNAVNGVRLGSPDPDTIPDVVLKNVIIENMSNAGIINYSSDLYAENTLVNNCIEFNCANIGGGNYTYKHCTFANYSFNFIRQSPSFFVSDNVLNNDSLVVMDVFMTLQNSIIYGDQEDEIFFDSSGGGNFYLAFNNNILKSTFQELDTLGNILNQDPEFIDPLRYNYRLDTLSPAKDAGDLLGILSDLDGNMRDDLPDIGAYERIE